jgi:uncharacterized membrane protein
MMCNNNSDRAILFAGIGLKAVLTILFYLFSKLWIKSNQPLLYLFVKR